MKDFKVLVELWKEVLIPYRYGTHVVRKNHFSMSNGVLIPYRYGTRTFIAKMMVREYES